MLSNERGVEFSASEVWDGECAPQELDIGRQSDHMVVFKGHVKCFNRLLPRWLMNDKF